MLTPAQRKQRMSDRLTHLFGDQSPAQIAKTLADHNVEGRIQTHYSCPLARVLQRVCKGRWGVGPKKIIHWIGGKSYETIDTPKNLRDFQVNFDNGKYPKLVAERPIDVPWISKAQKRGDYVRKPTRSSRTRQRLRDLMGAR